MGGSERPRGLFKVVWTVSGRLEPSPGLSDPDQGHTATSCKGLKKWSAERKGAWRDLLAVGQNEVDSQEGGGSEPHRLSPGEWMRLVGHLWTRETGWGGEVVDGGGGTRLLVGGSR